MSRSHSPRGEYAGPERFRSAPFPALPATDWDGIDLRRLWGVLVERAPWALGFLLLVVAGVGILTFMTERAYTAETVLMLEVESANVLDMKDVFASALNNESHDKTAFDVLLSRNLAERVIRSEELAKTSLFEPSALNDGVDSRWIDHYLKDGLEIEPFKESRLVAVRFTSPDPDLSARIANAHAAAFIQHGSELRSKASEQALSFLRSTEQELRQRVEESQLALDRVRRETGVLSLDESQSLVIGRLTQLNDLVTSAEARRIGLEAQVRLISAGRAESLAAVMESVVVAKLKQEIVRLEGEYAYQTANLKALYPKPTQVVAQLEDARSRLQREIKRNARGVEAAHEAALQEETELRARLESQQAEALRSQAAAVRHAIYARDEESNRRLHVSVQERIKEMSVLEELPSSKVFVIDRAYAPLAASKPRVALNLAIGLVFGVIGGILLALFVDYFDSSLRCAANVERHLGLPTLGGVPDFERTPRIPLLTGPRRLVSHTGGSEEAEQTALVVSGDPTSAASEAYRAIRTGLMLSRPDSAPRTILFTSSVSGEGKTVTAVNTALMFAQLGEPVLLIDADLRRPRCHEIFGMDREPGLTEVLTGHAAMFPQKVEGANLHVLQSGACPPNPTELLGSKRMQKLIRFAGSKYRYIFFDTPPLLPVSDAVVLAALVDGVVFVADANKSPRSVVREGVARLEAAHVVTLGVVLNRVHESNSPYVRYASDFPEPPRAQATA